MKISPLVKRTVSVLLAVSLAVGMSVPTGTTAFADDRRQELQDKVDEQQDKLDAINQQIADNAAERENAEKTKELAEQQKELIVGQITDLQELIARIEGDIQTKEEEIAAKQVEVDQKQAEYDARRQGFKERLGAMQKLNDGGSIALLSSATNLYQLLTFADTLEQISSKDEEICTEIETQRQELEQQRTELENAKADLEADKADLDAQNTQLEGKRQELVNSIQQQNQTISDADAQEEALEAEAAETRKALDAAAAALDAYLNSQVDKYSDAPMTCSLNFGPALQTYTYISCVFGTNGHRGTDFASPGGTPIYAVADGIVTDATYHWSWGNYVQIYHGKDDEGNTYSTLYAHMISTPAVSAGQNVTKGQVIGYVGSTGYSTGNHLHLEMKINGVLTNCLNWIPS